MHLWHNTIHSSHMEKILNPILQVKERENKGLSLILVKFMSLSFILDAYKIQSFNKNKGTWSRTNQRYNHWIENYKFQNLFSTATSVWKQKACFMPCGGLTLGGCQMPTKISLPFPLTIEIFQTGRKCFFCKISADQYKY